MAAKYKHIYETFNYTSDIYLITLLIHIYLQTGSLLYNKLKTMQYKVKLIHILFLWNDKMIPIIFIGKNISEINYNVNKVQAFSLFFPAS